MFGDILSDEASMITGSIGMIPVLEPRCNELRPVRADPRLCTGHCGSGPCKPDRHHLSAAMMLRYSFDMAKEADAVEHAVSKYLDAGYRTADIMEDGMTKVGCKKCGDLILEYLTKE